jgi:uncharacterized membrane protein YfhO
MTILNFIERKPFPSFLCILLCMLFFIFKDFLFLHKVYLFADVAFDSVSYSYPHFVHDSEYLQNTGIPKWSFNIGMGQNIFPISVTDPFSFLVSLNSKDAVPYAIAYVELLKIFLLGLFSFLYLRELKTTPFTSVIGALLFAFSGYTLLHGGWYYVFSAHAVYVVFLLFAFEALLKRGIWYWFPIPIVLIACLSSFYLALDCELLLLYAILRYIEEKELSIKAASVFTWKLGLLGLFGIIISSVCLFSGVLFLLDSPRVVGNLSRSNEMFSDPIFKFASLDNICVYILRMFSTDIFSVAADSPFKKNPLYLESAVGYCGLLTLILVPQIFYFLNKKKKILYGCILACFIIAIIFPFFRHMFWFFSGDYYRLFSFFFVIILLYYAIRGLDIIDKESKINKIPLFITLGILLILINSKYSGGNGLLAVAAGSQALIPDTLIDKNLKITITCLLILYSTLLYLFTFPKFKSSVKIILLLSVVVELVYFSNNTINKRNAFTPEILKQKAGYNDYTNEAMEFIHSADNGFFRVAKDYPTGYGDGDLNTSQYQNYMGTSAYSSFNQSNYLGFLYAMGIDTNLATAARSQGLNNKYILETWASVKYYLIKNPQSIQVLKPMGYDSIGQTGDVKIFKNKFLLPLGFAYKKYITEDEFNKANFLQKNKILLNAFVINNNDKEKYSGFSSVASSDFIPNNISMEEYMNPLKELEKDTLTMTNHTQNSIDGKIDLKEKEMLFFSIPYDKGWKATVNGKGTKLEKVNIGFMGLLLDKGMYDIHLQFEPPMVKLGSWVSVAGVLIYLYLFWKFRKIPFTPISIEEKKVPVRNDKGIKKKGK